MTEQSQISIAAFVSEGQQAAVQSATGHLARAVSQAAGVPWRCNCVFGPDLETLGQGDGAAIIVTSLLPQLEETGEPWPQAEQRLRTTYAALCQGRAPVFICTILRHVSRDQEPETAAALRRHIRRLNLLAAEISRETGAYVIDLDRVLADIGARRLQTDYRLAGNAAVDMTGHFIALTLVDNALDALVSFEVQDAARAILASDRPAIAEPDSAKPEVTFWKDLQAMGRGRRKQIVSPAVHTIQENYAGWFIRHVLQGKIDPVEALQRLVRILRRRGVRETAALLAAGLSRQINSKT